MATFNWVPTAGPLRRSDLAAKSVRVGVEPVRVAAADVDRLQRVVYLGAVQVIDDGQARMVSRLTLIFRRLSVPGCGM